ncbi:hypothetical protein DPX16_5909 [Anabarilius grahami]|uniref:Uncharacterized protein n=1 Tax=Anabarilius grahami TaxID=495550 RepID=A0A3N0Y300_ANAGA|nr:hypothetical protein DPX16_5909 [Anabarilius grahami]
MSIAALEGEQESSGDEDSAVLPPSGTVALPESDPELAAVLSRAVEKWPVGQRTSTPDMCVHCSSEFPVWRTLLSSSATPCSLDIRPSTRELACAWLGAICCDHYGGPICVFLPTLSPCLSLGRVHSAVPASCASPSLAGAISGISISALPIASPNLY